MFFKPQTRLLNKAMGGLCFTRIHRTPLKASTPPTVAGSMEGKKRAAEPEDVRQEKQEQRFAVFERRIAAVETLAARLQQRQGLLESHLSEAEAALAQLRGDLTEARRVLGEGALERQNVSYLIEQMQRAVRRVQDQVEIAGTHNPAAPLHQPKDRSNPEQEAPRGRGTAKAADADPKTDLTEDRVRELVEEVVERWVNTARVAARSPDPPTAPNLEGAEFGPAPAGVEPRLFDVELRLAALESEKSQRWLEDAAVERLRAVGEPSLAELLRGTGALPFQDATGHTRLASQRVLIYDVPSNVGAAEVHELCASVVGGRHGVLTCLVRRLPIATPTTTATLDDSTKASAAPSSEPSQGKGSGRFRSQRSAPSTSPSSEKIAPKGRERVALRRAFEVTFASAQLAVLAIQQLNGITAKPGPDQPALRLHAEPVLSADILAAFRRLGEQEGCSHEGETAGGNVTRSL